VITPTRAPVREKRDVAQLGLPDGVEDSLLERRRRGRRLGQADLARLLVEVDEIGERPADVDGHAGRH
jgi:hypothetical protein